MGLYQDLATRMWLVVSIAFGAAALAIWIYVTFGVSFSETAFGQRWTGIEITLFHLPLGSVPGVPENVGLPIQFKPVTGFTILAFLWVVAALQSLKPQFTSMPPSRREGILMVAFLFCLVAGYEFIWNIAMWFTKLAYLGPISSVPFEELVDTVTWETFYYPVNLTFATKMFGCVFAIATYTIHFLTGLKKRGSEHT